MSLWTMFSRYWFWPVFALLVLFIAMMVWPGQKWSNIEEDVARLTQQTLMDKGFTEATVLTENRGRDVLISATVRSEEEKRALLEIAAGATDSGGRVAPRNVKWNGFVNPAPVINDAELGVDVLQDSIILSGVLSSQTAIDNAVLAAQIAYPGKNVENRLSVGTNVQEIVNIRGLLDAFRVPRGELMLRGDKVELNGMVDDFELKQLIGNNLSAALGDGYSIDNNIKVVATPVELSPELVLENRLCQEQLADIMSQSNIYFETGSADIKAQSADTLSQIVNVLSECPAAVIEIAGHTDSSGQADLNMALSQRRAESVANYLTETAKLSNTITAIGYGDMQPIADNATELGRAENRRIQFIIK